MSRTAPPCPSRLNHTFPDRLLILVPWKRAQWLRDSLRSRYGLRATACFEPHERTAGLEFQAGIDREVVFEALRELGS